MKVIIAQKEHQYKWHAHLERSMVSVWETIYRISSNTAWVSNWTLSQIEPGLIYPSKLKSWSLFKSWFQPSLDLNLGEYGPWN